MLKTTFIGLAVVTSLSFGALSPALAAYGHCVEQPDAADCRTYNMPGLPAAKTGGPVQKPIVHAHNHHYYTPQRG
ncbi:MAG TPA: hypothetical protein VNS88_01235 [Nitrospiraceae bacterium]|nr:hypothetical protein [Nitrospiraceae bacterium]